MVNAWVMHCKEFAKKNGLAYGCAISNPECRASYHRAKRPSAKSMIDELEGLKPDDVKPLQRELAKALKGAGDPEELLSGLLRKYKYDIE